MLSLDLFDSKYERRLHEGAVDDLEQHRIDVLNDRMQELLARARTATPDQKGSLKQQYEKIKSERDSYYRVREAGIPGNIPTEKIPGKEELLKGRGRTYYEGAVSEDDVEDFLKAGGKITYGKPQKGPRSPGLGLASRHIGGGRDKMKPSRTGRGAHTQGKPVVSTEDAEKKNSRSPLNQRLDRLKVQARKEFPQVDSDVEALLLKLLDKEAHDDRQNRQTDARQDAELKHNFALDRDQEDEITDLQTQVGVREHGGGIGPRQHWQDLMQEDELIEGIKDTTAATAVIACLLTGGSLTGCATAPQKTTAQQVLKTGQDVGRTVQTAKKITRAGVEAEVNQEIRNLLRGMGNRPEELNNSNILRIWRKIKGAPPVQPEPQAPEYGPAPPVRRPQSEEIIREDNASEAAEQAILKRIMVAHTDLLKQYGPEKVMQAAEEVAYNVGDLGEIGSSDVSGWVRQVQQILGAVQEAKDKPSLRDPKDNPCWKGYHPVGTKKKNGRTVPNCVPNAKE